MNKVRTIAATIFAILAVILGGTPTQAAYSIPVNEAENVIYANSMTSEAWGVMIFNAGTSASARTIFRQVDDEFLIENMGELFTDIGRGEPLDAETLDIMQVQGGTFFDVDSELGPGAVIVVYAGKYVYTFIALNVDDYEAFAGWNIEVIEAETFEGVDVPRGFREVK